MSIVPFSLANNIGDRFLEMLRKHGINPGVSSKLENELLSLTALIEIWENPILIKDEECKLDILRSAAGLYDLGAKVLTVEPLQDFPTFLPHLRLIGEQKYDYASLGQNVASGPSDDTARKIAELYIGCLAVHVGTDVQLDSPTNAKGDNPDVMFTLKKDNSEQTSQRWALAIKTISTIQGQTIFERIREGALQIDDPKCSADRGMVVINAKSALDHDALWNGNYNNLSEGIVALKAQLDNLAEQANLNRPQQEWDDIFAAKVVRPIIFMGQTLITLPTLLSNKTPTILKMFSIYCANGTADETGYGIVFCMNEYMQKIKNGIPGGEGVLPS
ncbi:hypothetical protein [Serratia plymuthica]|uniref:hypothetical protein n=1 Tax=Serratia plymuthica TaxID=82996 RepID=UPI0007E9512B|nr:hypothetical protein [Serratia plymuthica]ANJ95186.1 hypothetical protein ADP72_20325 [Serratia plymuthica]